MDSKLTQTVDFSGRKAFDLYLKSLQLILRHQVWFLVHEKNLPDEFETIVFDLWALRIAQFGDRIGSRDLEADSQSQSQVYSTMDTEESDTTDHERGLLRRPKERDRKLAVVPSLKDCLALCYLGILTLRLPITPGDIYAMVTDGKLAYRRAIMRLPLVMRDRLPPAYHHMLDPSTLLKYKSFYTTLTNLQLSYRKDHGILWPALNASLLLFRYLKELALPVELYDATLRLAEYLGYDYKLQHDDHKRLGIRHLPEAQLIGCLIVCVKLLYPFDDEQRHPKSASEPPATKMNWEMWCKHMDAAKSKQGEGLSTEQLTTLEEKDVFSMSSTQLDQYLDFYANAFLDDAEIERTKQNNDFRKALYEMFPIEGKEKHPPDQISDRPSYQERLEIVKAVHTSMEPVVKISEESRSRTLRPGQMYQSWKSEEYLPEYAKRFYEEAGRIAGFSMDMLVLAVFFTEAKIEKTRRKRRHMQFMPREEAGEDT